MSEKRIRELVAELVSELENKDGVNEETLEVARKLQDDIDDVINPNIDTSDYTVLDDAIALEASFAAEHPLVERIVRELINNLSRIGI